jgi:hypothetical protein
MNDNSMFKVIWLKAVVAFGIPFFTAAGGSLMPYSTADSASPNTIGWCIIIFASLVAGFSGLGSFLSTTFAEHKLKQEAGVEDTAPTPQVVISAAPQVAPPVLTTVNKTN